MNKALSILPLVAGLLATNSVAARAQTATPASAGDIYVTIGVGGQLQGLDFTTKHTFQAFSEDARADGNQTVGRGFLVHVTGGYHLSERTGVAVGLWTAVGKGNAALVGAIPDPLFFNRASGVSSTASGLQQRTTGLDLQFFWTRPITDRIELAIAGGPTIMHVNQEIATFTVASNTVTATAVTESKITPLAGNIGVDARYLLNERYAASVFVRYVGGQVDLPSAENMAVGGFQVGAGLRYRF